MTWLILLFYSWFMWLAQPLLRRKLARRGLQEPGYLDAVEERFGNYWQLAEPRSELVWIHAVSLGETRTATALLKALRTSSPRVRILLTHGTATGRAEGLGLLRAGDVQVWQPWDSTAAVDRFFTHFKPRLGLLMETEIWPITVALARKRAMPLVLVNGRLSDKSLQQALRLAVLSRPAYAALSAVYAQTEDDAERFLQLGANVKGVFGNLKFDASPNPSQQIRGEMWRRAVAQPVLMFASSREGEEDDFLKEIVTIIKAGLAQAAINSVAKNQQKNFPQSRFKALIVPRHPQRFAAVQALIEQHGLRVSRRSNWAASPAASEEAMAADVWLGDSVGEMALYYALSDVALLGGSFGEWGGQNLIEAAACGCPVVMGPHTFNFADAAELAASAGAAQRVANLAEAVQAALLLMSNPSAQTNAAAAGVAFAASNRGATQKTLNALQPYLHATASYLHR